ncbi:hypothetical protein QR680_015430 [Steinernema hermaphroditum]|uniref:NF-kappa-B inhibitor alpha n=1 Tax=Steinernema hermaphroditum TaxID=289476 RepID=A0AA39H7X0_9BILA|nr:hypothetical protein QR680_015430 [Steinernema hermaphroditum]
MDSRRSVKGKAPAAEGRNESVKIISCHKLKKLEKIHENVPFGCFKEGNLYHVIFLWSGGIQRDHTFVSTHNNYETAKAYYDRLQPLRKSLIYTEMRDKCAQFIAHIRGQQRWEPLRIADSLGFKLSIQKLAMESLKSVGGFDKTALEVALRWCGSEAVARLLGALPEGFGVSLQPMLTRQWNREAQEVAIVIANNPKFREDCGNGNTVFHFECDKKIVFAMGNITKIAEVVNNSNDGGLTPVHLAIQRQDLAATVALFSIGANLNEEDMSGEAALHYAVRENDANIVKFLLGVGAKAGHKNAKDKTPLQLAVDLKFHEIRELLEAWLDQSPPDSNEPIAEWSTNDLLQLVSCIQQENAINELKTEIGLRYDKLILCSYETRNSRRRGQEVQDFFKERIKRWVSANYPV